MLDDFNTPHTSTLCSRAPGQPSDPSNQSHPHPQHYPFPTDLSPMAPCLIKHHNLPFTGVWPHSLARSSLLPEPQLSSSTKAPGKFSLGSESVRAVLFLGNRFIFTLQTARVKGTIMPSCYLFPLAERKLRARMWLIPSTCLGLRDTYFV